MARSPSSPIAWKAPCVETNSRSSRFHLNPIRAAQGVVPSLNTTSSSSPQHNTHSNLATAPQAQNLVLPPAVKSGSLCAQNSHHHARPLAIHSRALLQAQGRRSMESRDTSKSTPRDLKHPSWSPRNASQIRNGMKSVSKRRYEIKPCIIRNLKNIGHACPR